MRSGGEFGIIEWIRLIFGQWRSRLFNLEKTRKGFRNAILPIGSVLQPFRTELFTGVDSHNNEVRAVTYQGSPFHGQVAELTKMICERRSPDFGGLRGSFQRIPKEI